ncbi:radical SAM protein [Intestinibacter sp.]
MKSSFSYKDIYIEDGQRVLEINILPEKHCNFDCVFCPIGRSKNKVDMPTSFEESNSSIEELGEMIDSTQPDLVFINSKGEALVNDKVDEIIDFIKSKGVRVRLLSNGYILSKDEYINIVNKCDEVVGEIKVITEEDFKKVQRPIEGYTLATYIENMVSFNKQYDGKFIFEVTIIKKYNADDESVEKLKNIITRINPDKLEIVRIDDEKMRKTMWVDDERFEEIKNILYK